MCTVRYPRGYRGYFIKVSDICIRRETVLFYVSGYYLGYFIYRGDIDEITVYFSHRLEYFADIDFASLVPENHGSPYTSSVWPA